MFTITGLKIPMNAVIGDTQLLLIGVAPIYTYEDGKRTDVITGYKYQVVEMHTFEKFFIKVTSSQPVITPEQIEASRARIKVQAIDCYARIYRTNTNNYDLSFTASNISIVKPTVTSN